MRCGPFRHRRVLLPADSVVESRPTSRSCPTTEFGHPLGPRAGSAFRQYPGTIGAGYRAVFVAPAPQNSVWSSRWFPKAAIRFFIGLARPFGEYRERIVGLFRRRLVERYAFIDHG